MDAVWSEDEQIIVSSDHLRASFRLRDNKFFHLEVSEGSTHAQLTVDAIMEYTSVCSFDSLTFIGTIWCMLRVKLLPASVLLSQGGDWVTDVGHS